MKLNLGCGTDVRLNYLNIDRSPTSKEVTRADVRTFAGVDIKDNSVTELVAINLLPYIHFTEIQPTLALWAKKLAPAGEMFIQTFDSHLLGTMMMNGQIDTPNVNGLLFGVDPKDETAVSIYNLPFIEELLKQLGCQTVEKGYSGPGFYIRTRKGLK